MKVFVKGDFEGFFTLGVDNMVVLILMSSLCLGVLGYSNELFFYRILPATAVGLIIGNMFYAYQAHKLANKENRDDVCALPYGTSILTVIIFGFLIMYPTQQKALADGLSKEQADLISWYAGIIACYGSGLIEFFGSPFPTSIYLGHPGYKKMGSRAGYSTLNGAVWSIVCFTGTLSLVTYVVPIEAGMAVLIWLGIVMCSLCFQATARRHAPAVVLGLIPAFAAFVATAVKHALAVSGDIASRSFFDPSINQSLATMRSFFSDGMFAVSQGYLYTSMVLTAALVHIIDRQFNRAAIWFLIGAALSMTGFTSSYLFTSSDVIGALSLPIPVWNKWTTGYCLMALMMIITPYITVPTDQPAGEDYWSIHDD